MHLNEARKVARNIEAGSIDPVEWFTHRDKISKAFHRLDQSEPTTQARRREDVRLAGVIWRWVGSAPIAR